MTPSWLQTYYARSSAYLVGHLRGTTACWWKILPAIAGLWSTWEGLASRWHYLEAWETWSRVFWTRERSLLSWILGFYFCSLKLLFVFQVSMIPYATWNRRNIWQWLTSPGMLYSWREFGNIVSLTSFLFCKYNSFAGARPPKSLLSDADSESGHR